MYLDYFDKFLDMIPYLEIKEDEWNYIKQTFEKQVCTDCSTMKTRGNAAYTERVCE